MQILGVKLNGTKFTIEVEPEHTIADIKTSIEELHHRIAYPAAKQMIFYDGKLLRDDSPYDFTENSTIAVALEEDLLNSKTLDTSEARVPVIVQPVHTQSTDSTPATPTVPDLSLLDHYLQDPRGGAEKYGKFKFELLVSKNKNPTEVYAVSKDKIEALRSAAKEKSPNFPSVLREFCKQDPALNTLLQDHKSDFIGFITGEKSD